MTKNRDYESNDVRDDIEDEGFEYRPTSDLKIPEEIKEQFLNEGYYLRWVRAREGQQLDFNNIRRRMRDKYTLVAPEELGEHAALMGMAETLGTFGEAVTVGDLVLMKIKVGHAEARRKYVQDQTRQKSKAVDQMLRENQIQNDSRSMVRTGKFARFSGD